MAYFFAKIKNSLDKNSPKLWTANYIYIVFSNLSLMLAFSALLIILPVYIEQFEGMAGAAGLPITAMTIGAVATRPLTGWALDTYGRKLILFYGFLLFLLPSVIFIWMLPPVAFIIFRLIQGAGWGIVNTAMSTVAADNIPSRRIGEGIGIFTLTISLAVAIAPAAGFFILASYNFPFFFKVVVLFIIISMVLCFLIKYPPFIPLDSKPKLKVFEKTSLKPAVVMFLFTFSYSSVIAFIIIHSLEQGIANAGLFFTSMAVTTIIVRPVVGWIMDTGTKKTINLIIGFGVFCLIASMPVIALVSSTFQHLSSGLIFGLGFGIILPAMLTICIRNAPADKKGAANATYWTAYDLGIAVGSLVWGLIAAVLGYQSIYFLSIIPLITGLLIFYATQKPGTQGPIFQ